MYLQHLTPSKTMSMSPSAANTVHHQPLKIEHLVCGSLVRDEAQFASLNIKYRGDTCCHENRLSPPRVTHVTPWSVVRRASQSDLLIDSGKY
jgi:hypothetical protein